MPIGGKIGDNRGVVPKEREKVYERVCAEPVAGHQAYVICPRIDLFAQAGEPNYNPFALEAKLVKVEAARLKKSVFPRATSVFSTAR